MVDSRRTRLKKRFCGKTGTLLSMLFLTSSFFFVEIIVGYATNSMALVADSFHMLSDIISLIVGFLALRYSKRRQTTERNTFGWQRAEVLGAVVNSVFLIALCFSIFVESLKRFAEPESIHNPVLVLIVGVVGLIVNVIGLVLFHEHGHGHSHGGESHEHGDDSKYVVESGTHGKFVRKSSQSGTRDDSEKNSETADHVGHEGKGNDENGTNGNEMKFGLSGSEDKNEMTSEVAYNIAFDDRENGMNGTKRESVLSGSADQSEITSAETAVNDVVADVYMSGENEKVHTVVSKSDESRTKVKSSAQLNMRGVYLHVLGDALGSVIVIISALIIKYATGKWTIYVDPGMSIFMVLLILKTSIPLMRESSLILLQTVPTHIKIKEVQDRLLDHVEGVLSVHEFHVWQLAGDKIIASAHITCRFPDEYMVIANKIKIFFHNEGIHSTTIQPEFVVEDKKGIGCSLECGKDEACTAQKCCPVGNETTLRKRSPMKNTEGAMVNEGFVV